MRGKELLIWDQTSIVLRERLLVNKELSQLAEWELTRMKPERQTTLPGVRVNHTRGRGGNEKPSPAKESRHWVCVGCVD